MKQSYCSLIILCLIIPVFTLPTKSQTSNGYQSPKEIRMWTTTADKKDLLTPSGINITYWDEFIPVIIIDSAKLYQRMDGFGFTLTGGSASLINKMENSAKDLLLKELFSKSDSGISVSYLRISMGASDLSHDLFSYDDLDEESEDLNLAHFSLSHDTTDLIPVLKKIIKLNPDLKIMASPWSPPLWMKSNKNSVGGYLLPEYYEVYAAYFVKYIDEMKKNGIPIEAVTIQNEPQHGGNNPSMLMSATQQADFIKNHLGPGFEHAGIKTSIVIWDHNCDQYQYPLSILNDPQANKYVDGSAFHLYAGDISALSLVHDAFPDKNIYFTEQWTDGNGTFGTDLKWHTRHVVIGSSRHWSKVILEWNLANDATYNPHTEGGCSSCQGALTIENNVYTRNVSYYIIGHISRFVPAGSVRISSSLIESVPNVAFLTPTGQKVLLMMNEAKVPKRVNVRQGKRTFVTEMKPESVNTFVW
ncbi:MAG: glucosylceramidase [Saprospiraceae bacterium]|nr:glucosylceramidase [Saprospiraceae bacterium]